MIDETSSSVDAPNLPYDLVEEEILSRLPVKFLLQIRCVCKSWNSLISDSKFIKKHLSMSTACRLFYVHYSSPLSSNLITHLPLQCIFTTVSTDVKQLEYPSSHFNFSDHVIVGYCNGIICLAHANSVDNTFVLLWNPSIRKVKELPQPCYPDLLGISYGFGYDSVTDNYNVVAVLCYQVCDSNGDLLEKAGVMINTLGTDVWKNMQEFPFDGLVDWTVSGTFITGTINWLASKCWWESPCFIVSLDLGTESYQKFLLPDYGDVDLSYLKLCVLKDFLCVILDHDVWIMKEYGNKESWIKLFNSMPYCLVNALYMFEDDQVLLESFQESFQDGSTKLIVHDARIGSIKSLDKSVYNPLYDAYPVVCIESMISPF